MKPGRLVLIVLGALSALVGLGLLAGGSALVWAHTTQRDTDGFYTSTTYELRSAGHAVTAGHVHLSSARPGEWAPDIGDVTVRITVTSPGEAPVFVGIAEDDALASYLSGVAHDEIERLGDEPDEVAYDTSTGAAVPAAPATQDFWVASAEGSGTQTLTWDVRAGTWSLAVMNADGSAGVEVSATAAGRAPFLLGIGIGLLVAGSLLVLLAAGLLVAGAARDGQMSAPPSRVRPAGVYPVRVEGTPDPGLSRWQWLVKWFLAIPHYVVLAFLWAAFVVLTVFAGFAILFTGRYPRGIFDFNVGVLRWTWRVVYYATGVLGTDRYPPFTLTPVADYPAELDVEYPEQLSRGLVLVKWWLLAIPHYVIVGIFTGSIASWTIEAGDNGGWQVATGGLVGILVFVAMVVLLFTGRYPRGLYDLIMGLQRWTYRVIAYAALMTDVYPPFRLDTGGSEPGAPPPPPPAAPPDGTAQTPELVGH